MSGCVKQLVCIGLMLGAILAHAAEDNRDVAPPMGIGLCGVSPYGNVWQFVDMMKHSREWRARKDWQNWTVVEDENGWPVSLEHKDGTTAEIDKDHPIFMYSYYRKIEGDVVLTWEGDGDLTLRGSQITLKEDGGAKRRVYSFTAIDGGVFDVAVSRSNPADPVRNIRMWMPGFENSKAVFHPQWKDVIKPFPCLRFMDWGATNNSEQKEWSDRKRPEQMRQTHGVAYEYMLRLCNEMGKDAWICIPHMASDDYVRQLGKLVKAQLTPGLRVYVEYSNEIWNPSFRQTQWLWARADEEIKARDLMDAKGRPLRKWEYGPVLCGRRSAQIWEIMADELGDPDRIIRTITHFRWLDKCLSAALDKANGEGRVDLIALNGYFISQDSLTYALRDLDHWDIDEVMDVLQQQHLLGKSMSWAKEMANVREAWPGIPITSYEGGQHFANPFSSGLQGKKLTERMFEVNADRRIKDVYATALETWHLAGGSGFTAFVECGTWSKYGCWGHKQYVTQPLEDRLDAAGVVVEPGAHKYKALLDYMARRTGQDPDRVPSIATVAFPDASVGKPYQTMLTAEGGSPPYTWSLLGGRLPEGLSVTRGGAIQGIPVKAEQLVCIIDCTDSRNQHTAKVFGLFIDPSSEAAMQRFDFSEGLPAGWKLLKGEGKAEVRDGLCAMVGRDIVFLSSSAGEDDSSYTAEVSFMPRGKLNQHATLGLAFNLSPDGDPEDYLRVVVDGLGHRAMVYSRYVRDSKGELWGRRECPLLRDAGEDESDAALDEGELWTLRVTVRPGASPGAIDLLVSVNDQSGKCRLDPAGRNDVANGIYLLRELAIKDALRRGPLGLMADNALVKQVRWRRN